MSDLVAAWNELAAVWWPWLLQRSVAASVTLVVVGLLLLALRRRLSAHAPSHLMLLPIVVLVLPVERALPTYWPEPMPNAVAFTALPTAASPDVGRAERSESAAAVGPVVDRHAPPSSADMSSGAPVIAALEWPAIVFAMWLLVLLGGCSWLLAAQLGADRRLRQAARRPDPDLQRLFERLCSERGFDRPIRLRTVAGLASPIASGIVDRVVYLPTGLDGELSATQMRFVLLHELEHHARRDVLVEGLLRVVRFAFWFHPAVFCVIAAHRRWREYACDEAAAARAAVGKRAALAEALFTLIQLANDAPRSRGLMASFSPATHIMKNRLQRILDRRRSPHRSLSATSTIVVAVTGLAALTVARAQQKPVTVKVQPPAGASRAAVTPKPDGEVAVAIDQGLAWLLQAQEDDGRWDIGSDPQPRYPRDHNVVHVTGLAVRALLCGWDGPRRHEIARAVERADDYLQRQQNAKGLFGGGEALAEHYGHAQVLRALCAIQRVMPDDQRKASIARGVAFAERVRNPYAGWRYRPRDNDNDSKHTALMLLAFQDAAELGLEVPPAALQHARELLVQLTDEETGRTGFVRRGEPMSRFVAKVKRFPKKYSEEPTAMHLLVEAAFDDEEGVGAAVRARAADLVRDMPPRWDPEAGTTDYAYWCFGARAMAEIGGAHAEVWRKCLHAALLDSRIVEGSTAHWPADDAWGRPGMEAYSTASALLALYALH
ncbi:MAG: hypothetical protein NXI31_20960 [bacterium]|nr:hypothetical protein [bacterium]